MDATSRAVPLAAATPGDAAPRLASLLACLAKLELRLRSGGYPDNRTRSASVGSADLLRYLRVSAPHLPRPDRPLSLVGADHLSASESPRGHCEDGGGDEHKAAFGASASGSPRLGDVLLSVLEATAPESNGRGAGNVAVSDAVSAVVLHGYGRRPLLPLAAVAIRGASSPAVRDGASVARRHGRGCRDENAVAAARALCVAATFLTAAAGTAKERGPGAGEDSATVMGEDVVSVFPAAVLAVAADDKVNAHSEYVLWNVSYSTWDGLPPAGPTQKGLFLWHRLPNFFGSPGILLHLVFAVFIHMLTPGDTVVIASTLECPRRQSFVLTPSFGHAFSTSRVFFFQQL